MKSVASSLAGFSTPHDEESLIRFAEEVKPHQK
jgi:hypothetical protein